MGGVIQDHAHSAQVGPKDIFPRHAIPTHSLACVSVLQAT